MAVICFLMASVIGPGRLGWAQEGPPSGPPPQAVRLDPVRMEKMQDRRLVTGEVRAVRRSKVAGQEAGLVAKLEVEEGDVIKAGSVLARLDNRRLTLQVQSVIASKKVAQATLEERRAEVKLREWQYETLKPLVASGASREEELREAESAASVARAKLVQAKQSILSIEANRAFLQQRLDDTVILAPFDAAVVSKHTELGEWLEEGGTVVEIVAVGDLDAWFDVPEGMIGALNTHRGAITIQIQATSQTLETSTRRIIPQVDPRARTFPVAVRFADPSHVVKPGMSATAWMPTGDSVATLTIAKDAVLRNEAGLYVYRVRKSEGQPMAIAEPVPIRALFSTGDRLAIRSDRLAADDRLVVEGNERLFPGAPVFDVLEAEKHVDP